MCSYQKQNRFLFLSPYKVHALDTDVRSIFSIFMIFFFLFFFLFEIFYQNVLLNMVSNCKCVKTCTESKSFRSKRQWCSLKKVVLKNLCRVSFLIKQIISEIIKFSCCICSGFLLRILSHTYQPWCKHFFKIVLVVQEMSFLQYLLSRDLKNDTNFI